MQELSAALKAADTSAAVQLGGMRKATVSEFKGRHFVNVREYYEKDGQQLPGKKGIALDVTQWESLTGLFDAVLNEVSDAS